MNRALTVGNSYQRLATRARQRYHGLRRRLWPILGWNTLRVLARRHRFTLIVDSWISWERAEAFATAEPETLDWIDSMAAADVLFDVGANVGIYSLYAGARGVRVWAFEPEAVNAGRLQQHIALNGLVGKVTPYVVALADRSRLDLLYLNGPAVLPAAALHAFGRAIDYADRPFNAVATQGCYGTTLDALIEAGLPVPTHIKIDVDGLESAVIDGARRLLAHPGLRSILIEISHGHEKVADRIQQNGFRRVDFAPTTTNHIFVRD